MSLQDSATFEDLPQEAEPAAEIAGPVVNTDTGIGAKKEFLRKAEKLISGKPKQQKIASENPKVINLLRKSLKAYKRHDYIGSVEWSLEATKLDEGSSQAFHILAMGLENIGELHKALVMYERAMKLDPTEPEIYLNLGMIAWRMKLIDGAERLFRLYSDMDPQSHSGYNNLGGVLRDKGNFDDAIEVVRGAIMRLPEEVELWNTMGTIVMEAGDPAQAITFYKEAIRLNPSFARAWYNIAYTLGHTGPQSESLEYYNKASELQPDGDPDKIETWHGRSLCKLAMGKLEEGWKEYEIRHSTLFRGAMLYATQAPRWQGEDVTGKRVLVVAEQGLGDEILFANPIGDLVKAVGPEGQVLACVNGRLLGIFARSYPEIKVGNYGESSHNGKHVRLIPWQEQFGPVDYYAPMGDLCQRLRPTVDSYRPEGGFLKADPEKVADWKLKLAELPDGFNVGICWKSLITGGHRRKYYSPFEKWGPIFANKKVNFINLQYGDCEEDIKFAKDNYGIEIIDFEGFNIKDDLESNIALCEALDLVVSAPTAAAALAAAAGTKTWFIVIAAPGWPQLGQNDYPFYADTEVFAQKVYGEWDETFDRVGTALKQLATQK